jgi:hypothetical protein
MDDKLAVVSVVFHVDFGAVFAGFELEVVADLGGDRDADAGLSLLEDGTV